MIRDYKIISPSEIISVPTEFTKKPKTAAAQKQPNLLCMLFTNLIQNNLCSIWLTSHFTKLQRPGPQGTIIRITLIFVTIMYLKYLRKIDKPEAIKNTRQLMFRARNIEKAETKASNPF